ncbi:hypothetical protein CRUP_020500 [Coryphaenoides rupestris]|nr:hypothetical protein CRUP_020500 [Coryphaenoides rupestris]
MDGTPDFEALGDLTKAIQLQPSARLYRHRGTLLFISEVAYNPRGLLEVRQALENVNQVEDLLPIMKQFNSKTRDGFTVNSKVPSMKDPGKEYDGFTITITGDRVGNMLFSVEGPQTTEGAGPSKYQSEIEVLSNKGPHRPGEDPLDGCPLELG